MVVYFSVNLFLSGVYFALAFVSGDSFWQKVKVVVFTFLIALVGLPCLVTLFFILLVVGLFKLVNTTFKVGFFFEFYFTNKYRRLEDYQVESLRQSYELLEGSSGLRHAMSRKCIRMILSRYSKV